MRKTGIIIFLFLMISLCGCSMLPKRDKDLTESPAMEPHMFFKFSDIPVPKGFKFLDKQSYSFESMGVRVGVLKYQGKAEVERVINFYKEQMAMYNWDLLNVIEYGERLLNFERSNETCIVNLSPKGRSLIITISIGPKPQVLSPKRMDKPVK